MPFLGRQVVTNLADFHVDNYASGGGFTAGSTTQLTLTVAGIDDEEALSIFFDGVHQHHNTFIIASSVVTFDTAIPTGTANVEIHYGKQPVASALAANVIDSEHYVDGSIDLVHMSSQSVDEDNLHISNSGSNGQFLSKQSGDAGGLTWAAAGGGWSYVSTATASNSATLDFVNMESGYDYKYMVDYMIMAADNKYFDMRVGVAGPTYRTSGYLGVVRNSAAAVSSSATGEIRIVGASAGIGNGTNENLWGAEILLSNPASATYKTTVMAHAGFGDNSSGAPTANYAVGNYTTAEANTCARFFANTGNISSGTILQYRRSRT